MNISYPRSTDERRISNMKNVCVNIDVTDKIGQEHVQNKQCLC